MQVNGTKSYLSVKKSTARPASVSAQGRSQAQDGYYDHFSVSSSAAQDRSSFRNMVASLSHQVRTYNTTGKIQELRRQVSAGEYQIEPRETAARMLLLTGEGE